MTTLFLFALATIGLTNVLVHGAILDDEHLKIRSWLKSRLGRFGDLFNCYECTGWWAGLIMALILVSWRPNIFLPCAFAGAALGHLYTLLTNFIESHTAYELTGDDHESDETTT